MTKESEATFIRRFEDWLTVLDGRKNDAIERLDDFISMYPKVAGCAVIAAIILFAVCCISVGVIGEFYR